jgi:hypothetical protein
MNRNHGGGRTFFSVFPVDQNFGSSSQVIRHSGHFEGLFNFPENTKPQARQRAGSITALYSVCLRLRKR